jgi:hypothetical protein
MRCDAGGEELREVGSEESVAAGRATLMLIEELERLRLELRRAREQLERVDPISRNEIDSRTADPIASATSRSSTAGAGPGIRSISWGPDPSGLKRRTRAWKATARPHRRVRGSRRFGDRSSADLFAEQKPEKLERAAVRWHGRLEIETALLTLARSRSSRWRRWRARRHPFREDKGQRFGYDPASDVGARPASGRVPNGD